MKKNDLTIGQLEQVLLNKFPAWSASPGDQTGLSVGDYSKTISKVAVALDPTTDAINKAAQNGCNLLLTHHPPFFGNASDFHPYTLVNNSSGQLVFESARQEVALMNFHTALDVSEQGRAVLPKLLNLKQKHILNPADNKSYQDSEYGYGMVNVVKSGDKNITLKDFARKCETIFGRSVIAWGDSNTKLNTIATTTGSTGSTEFGGLLSNCVQLKVDCLVCGEIKYHYALSLKDSGVCIIVLGHDVSELPLTNCLVDALVKSGLSKDKIVEIDQSSNWF